MIQVGPIILKNAILCEDIRQEKNNKLILIGVFSGDVLVQKVPANIAFAFYLDALIEQPFNGSLHLKMSGPGEGEATLEAVIQTTKPDEAATLAIPRMDILIQQEGTFRLLASADNKNWVTVIEKRVIQTENLWTLAPISSGRPSAQSPIDVPDSSSPPEPSPPSSPKKRRRS